MAVLVVLALEIFPVIVAVGRAHDDVDMVFIWLGMFAERDAALVIEFDDDHGALDTVIECAVVFHAAHPAEIGVFQMARHFLQFQSGMPATHTTNMVFNQTSKRSCCVFDSSS